MPSAAVLKKKQVYFEKLINLIQTYPNILVVHADFIGSKQMQDVRIELRAIATVLMGKNTMIRTCLRQKKDELPDLNLDKLVEVVRGNIGFIFVHDPADISKVREVLDSHTKPAAAKAGVVAPCSVSLNSGPTGLDPAQTNFFQALNIATKIVKGTIELTAGVTVFEAGQKVTASQAALLLKMNLRPFTYNLKLVSVYQDGAVFDASVLDLTDEILMQKFCAGVSNVAALSREIGIPTAASLPHAFNNGFKNIAALCADLDYTFPAIETVKAFLADPSAFACAAPAAAAGGAAPAAAAAAVVEEEEEEEEDMDFDLFG
jgi:large subunit ribosomal protein LP0